MKRAFASIAGLVGLAALGRFFAKRRQPAESATTPVETAPPDTPSVDKAPADPAADPAEELRRKLADARGTEPEPAVTQAAPDETLEERRARVHAKARDAIDSMGTDSAGADPTENGAASS